MIIMITKNNYNLILSQYILVKYAYLKIYIMIKSTKNLKFDITKNFNYNKKAKNKVKK